MENLKKLRNEKGLTQQQLAERLGTNQQNINCYENRGVEPDLNMLKRIASILETTVDYLIGYSQQRYPLSLEDEPDSKELLYLFSTLPPDLKEHVLAIMRACQKQETRTPAGVK